MRKRAVFLDLNGTLVLPIKPENLSELTLIEDVEREVARLSAAGFLCPVVTIQSRINKGVFTLQEFQGWFNRFAHQLRSAGAHVLGPYVCPHRFKEPCQCKKPSAFLYQMAANEHGIDLQQSFVIGDSIEDVSAARRFGGLGVLVRTGWAKDPAVVERASQYSSHVAESLGKAVDWILTQA